MGRSFENDPMFTFFVRDELVFAVIIDPSLITESVDCFIDVNDQPGSSYGQSLSSPEEASFGAKKARVVTALDCDRFWDMLRRSVLADPAAIKRTGGRCFEYLRPTSCLFAYGCRSMPHQTMAEPEGIKSCTGRAQVKGCDE